MEDYLKATNTERGATRGQHSWTIDEEHSREIIKNIKTLF